MAKRYCLVTFTALIVMLALGFSRPALAQEAPPQLVDPSGNTLGSISADAPTARFLVANTSSQLADIQVLGIGQGFAPRFRVLNPATAVILEVGNSTGQSSVGGQAVLATVGAYIIEVSGEGGTGGQFVLTLQQASVPAPVDVVVGAIISESISSETPLRLYRVNGAGLAGQTLMIMSGLPDAGPAYSINDEATGRVIASSDGALPGGTYTLGEANGVYRIEVRRGSAGRDIPFTICLGCASSVAPLPSEDAATPTVTPTATATMTPSPTLEPCVVVSSIAGAINVRLSPSTSSSMVGALRAGERFPGVGQTSDASWLQLQLANGKMGWVSATIAHLEGDCGTLFMVTPSSGSGPGAAPAATRRSAGNTGPAPTATQASSNPAAPAAPTQASANNAGPAPTQASANVPPPAEGPAQPADNAPAPDEPLPDLQVAGMSLSAEGPDSVRLTVTITNAGLGDAVDRLLPVANVCVVELALCHLDELGYISAGASYTVGLIYPRTDGPLTHTVTIDTSNEIPETNESNNFASRVMSFTPPEPEPAPIQAQLGPDLLVTGATLTLDAAGTTATFFFYISNLGDADVGPTKATVCVLGCQEFDIPALGPGVAQPVRLPYAWPGGEAIPHFVQADSGNAVAELDEGNNYFEQNLRPE